MAADTGKLWPQFRKHSSKIKGGPYLVQQNQYKNKELKTSKCVLWRKEAQIRN